MNIVKRDYHIIYPQMLRIMRDNYNRIVLIQQYYIPKDKHRLDEINKCLQWNIENPLINEIHLLNENIYDIDILKHPKIKQINIKTRLTYKKAFDYGNFLGPKVIKLLSNSDISFDNSLLFLKNYDLNNTVLALTRYNIRSYEPFTYNLYNFSGVMYNNIASGAQDTWIFTNIRTSSLMEFYLGVAGCDSLILYCLERLGVKLLNNCLLIKTYHHHMSNIRYYDINVKVGHPDLYRYIVISK
jgi:hypothetical protein